MNKKGLKIIQNGRVTFVPYHPNAIKYWENHNSIIRGSRREAEEMVIWLETTEEEYRTHILCESNNNTLAKENVELKKINDSNSAEIKELKEMMLKLMAGADGEGEKKRGRPKVVAETN